DRALPLAWALLVSGGRFAGISFHSLEDRRVKRFLAERARGCVCPPDLPVCACGRSAEAALLARGGFTPSADEIARTPRAAPARFAWVGKARAAPARHARRPSPARPPAHRPRVDRADRLRADRDRLHAGLPAQAQRGHWALGRARGDPRPRERRAARRGFRAR